MNDSENIVIATAERIFADLADPQTINACNDQTWKAPLWTALSESGLTLAWVPEAYGGAGADLAEGFGVIGAAGRFALAVPLAETMLAGWLLAQAEIASPDGAMTVAPANPNDRIALDADGTLNGRARNVPFAREAGHIAVVADGGAGAVVALAAAADCRIVPGESLAGDPSDAVIFDHVKPVAVMKANKAGVDAAGLMRMGALVRSLQIAGALQTALTLSVGYANERVAFEKPIAKFQAVQHSLARLAGEVAAAVTAAGSAAEAVAGGGCDDDALLLEIAAAKIRCAEAAEKAAAIAHQVFGAIGFTREHILHRFTQRALGWRDDFGNESDWAVRLGRSIAARGADALWPLVASR